MNPLVKFSAFLLTNGSRSSYTPTEFCKAPRWLKILSICGVAYCMPVFLMLNILTVWLICCTILHNGVWMQSLIRILLTIAIPATFFITLFSLFFHHALTSFIETLPPFQHTWKSRDFRWCKWYLLTSVTASIIAIIIMLLFQ